MNGQHYTTKTTTANTVLAIWPTLINFPDGIWRGPHRQYRKRYLPFYGDSANLKLWCGQQAFKL